jgi:hypothetical protein
MAIWQFDLRLIPRQELPRISVGVPIRVNPTLLDENEPDFPFSLAQFDERVSGILHKADSWNGDLRRWGDEEGHRIDLWTARGKVNSIIARVDARSLTTTFLIELAALCRRFDMVFVNPIDGEVLPPSPRRLFDALNRSAAARFVADPETFLAELPADPAT